MNTEEINFRLTGSACSVVYKANFAGCTLELAEDKQSLQLIDEGGDHETWERDENGVWIFREGSNGQTPTLGWSEDYHTFLEESIARLTKEGAK